MTAPLATIVVVPRERFSFAIASLESVFRNTDAAVPLIYVDGGSPSPVRRRLEALARERGFSIIRTEYYLSPNEARNLGLAKVRSKYVVFLDNDVVVAPGWLDELVGCAEETGAEVVGPLYLIGRPEDRIVHMAGGEASVREEDGVVCLHEWHRFSNAPLAEVESQLRREATEIVEFHCMLVRRDMFERLGPLDEGFANTREHVDFCITVRNAGAAVYLAPEAIVTYVTPPPFAWSDIPYYLVRWSEAWCEATIHHANEKWHLNDDYAELTERWLQPHRRLALMPVRRWARYIAGTRFGDALVDRVERRVIDHGLRKRPQALPGGP